MYDFDELMAVAVCDIMSNPNAKREKAHHIRRQVGTLNTYVALMSSSLGRAFHTLHFFLVRTLRAGGKPCGLFLASNSGPPVQTQD